MDTAAKISIVGGVLNIAASFVVGTVLAGRRRTEPAQGLRMLLVVHTAAVMQGSMLLALTFATGLSDLAQGWETAAAVLLVAGSAFNMSGNFLNYRGRVEDQFAGKSVGLRLNVVNSLLATPGIAILLVGVISGW